MDEAEWLACTDPLPMLEFLGGKASERKLRLFACACVRRYWGMFQDNRSDRAIEVTERYADSRIRTYRWRRVIQGWREEASPVILGLFNPDAFLSARIISVFELESARRPHACTNGGEAAEQEKQIAFLRDIFGNPFSPVPLDLSSLRTPTTVALAQGCYDDRAFDLLPILADALEDAGCSDVTILDHLRGPGPHCRGCFVIDALLGKS